MAYDNPAARLRPIIQQGLQVGGDKSCNGTWAALLDANGNADLLVHRLAIVQTLPEEIACLLEVHYPSQLDQMTHWRDPLRNGFLNQNLGGQWQSFCGHVPAHVVGLLASIEELLHMRMEATVAKEDDLQRIADMFKETLAAITESDLPGRLKVFLRPAITELLRAVRDYKYSGALPVLHKAEAMLGHAASDEPYRAFLTDHALGKRLLENVQATAAILSISYTALQLGPAAIAFLMP